MYITVQYVRITHYCAHALRLKMSIIELEKALPAKIVDWASYVVNFV